jgi:hypothetical protein
LSSFKEKFRPRWEDRYLALPARASGIASVLALAIAHLHGVRMRPEPAANPRLRRAPVRRAAAVGMTAALCAFGVGAAAQDIGRPVPGPNQLSLSSAADRTAPEQSRGAPLVNAPVSPLPLAGSANPQPDSAPSDGVSASPSADSPQVPAPEPGPPAASLGSTALCAPTGAPRPAVADSRPGTPRPKKSPPSATSHPGPRCATPAKPTSPPPAKAHGAGKNDLGRIDP